MLIEDFCFEDSRFVEPAVLSENIESSCRVLADIGSIVSEYRQKGFVSDLDKSIDKIYQVLSYLSDEISERFIEEYESSKDLPF